MGRQQQMGFSFGTRQEWGWRSEQELQLGPGHLQICSLSLHGQRRAEGDELPCVHPVPVQPQQLSDGDYS